MRKTIALACAVVAAVLTATTAAAGTQATITASPTQGSVTLVASASQKQVANATTLEVTCQDGTDVSVPADWQRSTAGYTATATFAVSTTSGVSCQGVLRGPYVRGLAQVYAITYFRTA
jgi:hypothetical protein